MAVAHHMEDVAGMIVLELILQETRANEARDRG